MLTPDKKEGRFISILADGKFHETVGADADGAVLREYETSTGEKGSKYEYVYSKLEGVITNVEFQDGDFGEQILTTFSDGENEVTLALGVGSNFGEDLMKKLPAIKLEEPVRLIPYSFEDDKGKNRKGITVYQNDEKVQNYFYDAEKKENLNGYPTPEGDTEMFSKDEWKQYYLGARIFLVKYVKANIVPLFTEKRPVEATGEPLTQKEIEKTADDYPENKVNPEDIPF